MPCYHPLEAWQKAEGIKPVFKKPEDHWNWSELKLPCGQCIGCRLERSKQWAIRCVHEASLHQNNSFITLTYNDEHVPEGHTLVKRDFQLFMKRLRKKYGKVRYYQCGEYGSVYDQKGNKIKDSLGREIIGRPHFHACLFGLDFDDKELYTQRNGISLYKSKKLSKIWTSPLTGKSMGFVTVGAVTFESAAYIARYVSKKINGDRNQDKCDMGLTHYERVMDDGQIVDCQPEYTTMSRRPGIGADWFKHYKNDVYEHDSVTIRGKEMQPPRYYQNLLEEADPKMYRRIKDGRRKAAMENAAESTPERLQAKERVKLKQNSMLIRGLS